VADLTSHKTNQGGLGLSGSADQSMKKSILVAGSIARSASRQYLVYSEADFEVFRAAGRHVAPMG